MPGKAITIKEAESSWREDVEVLLDVISGSASTIEDSIKDYFEVSDEEIRDAIKQKIMSALELLQVAVSELFTRFGFVPDGGDVQLGSEDEEEEADFEGEEEVDSFEDVSSDEEETE